MIPKIIHYCWLSNDPIPQKLKECMETWKEKLPDYEFILWNFDRFDKNSSIWVQQAFDNKKYAFAADYIRLFAIYNYGGIYMDMDIEVLKDFESLLNQNLMIAYENPEKTGKIPGGTFGYQAPECFYNHEYNYDILQKQDYFALGMTIFYLKYGNLPIRGFNTENKSPQPILNIPLKTILSEFPNISNSIGKRKNKHNNIDKIDEIIKVYIFLDLLLISL